MSLTEARSVIERWRTGFNHVRPHSAHGGLTPSTVFNRSVGDRLHNPDPFRWTPTTIEAVETILINQDSHYQ